jgi:hypothetical protein
VSVAAMLAKSHQAIDKTLGLIFKNEVSMLYIVDLLTSGLPQYVHGRPKPRDSLIIMPGTIAVARFYEEDRVKVGK